MHTTVRYNMATTDATIDRVEFSDVIAPYVYAFFFKFSVSWLFS